MPPRSSGASWLVLVTEAFGGKGGIAQFNRDFLRALDRTGACDKVVVVPRLGSGLVPADCLSLNQRRARFGRLRYGLDALQSALASRPQVVMSGHLYHGPLASLLARITGARLVSVLHGTEIWSPINARHLDPLKRSELVVCVSNDTRKRCVEQVGDEHQRKVKVLPNTIEDRFSPGDRKAARARFALDDLPVLLTVGRLDDRHGYKGHDRIIPIVAQLKAKGRCVRYLIAGDGPDRPRLEALAASAGVSDLVAFLGYVPDDALPDLYRAADQFALPSTGEGFGIVYIEAMACGTPAIGLDIGGAREALEGLGKAVSEEVFPDELMRLLAGRKQDRQALAEATRSRFGPAIFEKRVDDIVSKHLS